MKRIVTTPRGYGNYGRNTLDKLAAQRKHVRKLLDRKPAAPIAGNGKTRVVVHPPA